jgi:hypothetical protein
MKNGEWGFPIAGKNMLEKFERTMKKAYEPLATRLSEPAAGSCRTDFSVFRG